MKLFLIFALLIVNNNISAQNKVNNQFLQILGLVESNNNDKAVGDRGKSIGRFQIQRECFLDAALFNKKIKFSYESLTNKANSEIIVVSYLKHYEPEAWVNNDMEKLARCWNGGPAWRTKKDKTDNYWKRFKRYMVDKSRVMN